MENIITDEKIIFEDNNMMLSNINNIYTYLDKIKITYLNVSDFLFYNKQTSGYYDRYYILDFQKFMIHNNINDIYYNLFSL